MNNQQGFSLIEVIISLSILSLAIAGASQLVQRGYQHLSFGQQSSNAAIFAHSYFNQLRNSNNNYVNGITNGTHNNQFEWQLQLSKIDNRNPNVNAFDAQLTVWVEPNRAQTFNSILIRKSHDTNSK